MKKGDFIWGGTLVAFILFVMHPMTHTWFVDTTAAYPYIGGFLKFALLATMGEMLVGRISTGKWKKAPGFLWRVIIWGFLGMVIALIFQIFAGGVNHAFDQGYLIGKENRIFVAFMISLTMNFTFAPTMMAFHRFTDTYLDLKYGEHIQRPSVPQVVQRIDWTGFVGFVLLKTVPFFWVPAHTITFLLPQEYRVLVAALLSIALGLLLTVAKKKK